MTLPGSAYVMVSCIGHLDYAKKRKIEEQQSQLRERVLAFQDQPNNDMA